MLSFFRLLGVGRTYIDAFSHHLTSVGYFLGFALSTFFDIENPLGRIRWDAHSFFSLCIPHPIFFLSLQTSPPHRKLVIGNYCASFLSPPISLLYRRCFLF